MRASYSSELFRLVRRPAAWVLLGAWMTLYLLFSYAFPYLAYATGDTGAGGVPPREALASTLPDQLVVNALSGTPLFAGALAVILGVLVVGSDDSWGTWKTLLTQGPTRIGVVGGKLLTLVTMAFAATGLTFATGAGVTTVIATAEGRPLDWPAVPELVGGFAACWLVLATWCLLGAALAATFRGVALPIGLGVVWVLAVENLVSAVAGSVLTALQPLRDALPGVNAGSLVHALTADLVTGAATPGVNDAVSGGQAVLTLAAYVGVFVVVTTTALRRRDVA